MVGTLGWHGGSESERGEGRGGLGHHQPYTCSQEKHYVHVKGSLARTDPKLELMYSCQVNVRESGVMASTGLPGPLPPRHAGLRVLSSQRPSPCGCSSCNRRGGSVLARRMPSGNACGRLQSSSHEPGSRVSLQHSQGGAVRMACRTTSLRRVCRRRLRTCSDGRQCWDGLRASKGGWQTHEVEVGNRAKNLFHPYEGLVRSFVLEARYLAIAVLLAEEAGAEPWSHRGGRGLGEVEAIFERRSDEIFEPRGHLSKGHTRHSPILP